MLTIPSQAAIVQYDELGFVSDKVFTTSGGAGNVTFSLRAYDIVVDPNDPMMCQCIGPDYWGLAYHTVGLGTFDFSLTHHNVFLYPGDPSATYSAQLISPSTVFFDGTIDTIWLLTQANQAYGILSFHSVLTVTFDDGFLNLPPGFTVVPLPGSVTMFAVGLALLAYLARRGSRTMLQAVTATIAFRPRRSRESIL